MPVKIAFLLRRANWIRTLAPLIEAAGRDPDIEPEIALFPDDDPFKPTAAEDRLPAGMRDRYRIRSLASAEAVALYLERVDAAVCINGRRRLLPDVPRGQKEAIWCAVFDVLDCTEPVSAFDDAELAFWPTPFYLDMAIGKGVGTEREMRRRARFSGYVRFDGHRSIRVDEVRAKQGIANDRPVVLLIPDAVRFNRISPPSTNALYYDVWCCDGPIRRLYGALCKVRTAEAVRRAFDSSFSFSAMITAIRQFCDRNGAQLVLAPRRRKEWVDRPFDPRELAAADTVIRAEEEFPQPLLQAIAVADLVICPYRSGSILDAAAAGKPYVTAAMPDSAVTPFELTYGKSLDPLRYDCPGVAWLFMADVFNRCFADKKLADFAIDASAQTAFFAKHLGPVDGRCGERVLREIKEHLGRTSASAR